jgi:hypothetical protein
MNHGIFGRKLVYNTILPIKKGACIICKKKVT